ncbi:MAG: hypothetical protein ACLQQ4_02770 [Bacteroidia bacterium]
MKKALIISTAVSGLVLLSLSACNSNNNSTVGENNKDTAKAVAAPAASQTVSDDDLLPNLLQIGSIIKSSELSYISGLTNPVSDAGQYNTAYERNLNLGIYLADLGYCTLNKQNKESTEYLKAVKIDADAIGIGQIFGSNAFYDRYQANLNNEDSLTALVADLQMKTDDALKANKQTDMRVVIYSGAWVENMYIAAKVYSKSKNSNSGVHLMEQMTILENMLKVLNKYKASNPHIESLYNDLKNVDDTYAGFDEAKNYNPDSKTPFAFTDAHIATFIDLLEKLHTKYIK